MAGAALASGGAIVCQQCQPGQIVQANNQIYQWQWINGFNLTTGSVDTCDGNDTCSSDLLYQHFSGHYDYVGIGKVDTSRGQDLRIDPYWDIFHNSSRCPHCGGIWKASYKVAVAPIVGPLKTIGWNIAGSSTIGFFVGRAKDDTLAGGVEGLLEGGTKAAVAVSVVTVWVSAVKETVTEFNAPLE
jgi:hypothetical protein